MFIDKDSIIINNVSMGQYITEARYEYNKLWTDSGRNLAGEMTATLVGIFPKIKLSFRKLTKDELKTITPILDSASQSLTYFDPTKNQSVTIDTYTGDYAVVNRNIITNDVKNEGFEISFIAIRKRS